MELLPLSLTSPSPGWMGGVVVWCRLSCIHEEVAQGLGLANDSPCVNPARAARAVGAFPAIGDAKLDLGPPREWHVSETGRDGHDGSAGQPVRTIEFAVDQHTLFADPLYRDSAARNFRLDARSPNRGAGADGATIGAALD